jgi:hypothetical protein
MSGEEIAEKVMRLVAELRQGGGLEKAYELVALIKTLVPPGVEWGFEISRQPGVSYIAEGGRIIALSTTRGEFGPFMETRIREIALRDLPPQALARVAKDPEGFVAELAKHLDEWRARASPSHPLMSLIDAFLRHVSRG